MMKLFIKVSLLFSGIGALGLLVFLSLFYLPVEKINKLKTGYVKVELLSERPQYSICQKQPNKWIGLDMVDFTSVHAIVVSEDWGYYQHFGIDFRQVYTAVKQTLFEHKPLRGASTITQQVAKNLFLSNEKSFWRKVKEAFLAVSLEIALPKKKILEIYLNIIEYGDSVYGIYDASKYYFGKEPLDLNPREGAFLAMVLPSPKHYSHSFERGELSVNASQTIDRILGKMVMARYLSRHEMSLQRMKKFEWENADYWPDVYSL